LATTVFAVMHADRGPAEFVFVFSGGLLIGYIFQRTRSLFFVTVIHGTMNVLVFGLFQAYS
ncbi:MAG: CPBP family intramembrane glutamic endopeptidase, partial [Archaeoglobaceae archaeon]